jgi:hypothetical protein
MKLHLPPLSRKLIKTVLLFVTLSLAHTALYAQTWNWALGEGDIGNDASNGVTTDLNSNTYITGNIAGKADFSGTIYQGNGIYEMFIAKYAGNGSIIWAKLAGGAGNDQGNAIKWKNGYLYVTGFYEDTATFESTQVISKGSGDAFIAKYNDDGNLLWLRTMNGTGTDYGYALDVDDAGNVFVAGNYEHAITLGTTSLSTANIYAESFFAKYDAQGNLVWAKSTVGNNANLITGLAVDYHGAFYVTGYFGGSFKVGSGTIQASTASYDIFLAKVEQSDGSLDWIRQAGSSYEDGAHGVCCDKDGYPSITGYFAGTAMFGNNSVTYMDYNDIFVAHYDTSGNNLWVRAGRGNKLDVAFAITCDNDGNVISTGMFQNVVDFDGHTLTSPDILDRDVFLISYDKNGNFRWIEKATGLDTDCGLALAMYGNGKVAISGYYLHTLFFGSIEIDYADGNDLFVAVYDPPVVNGLEEVSTQAVKLYPNPVNDWFTISCGDIGAGGTYTITNTLGEILMQGTTSPRLTINARAWPAGVYLLNLRSENKMEVLKLLKQ